MTEVRGEGPDGRSFTAPGHLSHTDTLPRASPRDKEGRRAGALALAPASSEEKLLGKPIPSGAAFPPLPHPARLHPPRPRGPPAGPPAPRWMSQKRKILGLALLKPPQAKRLQRGWTGNSSSNRRGRPGAKSPPLLSATPPAPTPRPSRTQAPHLRAAPGWQKEAITTSQQPRWKEELSARRG